MRSDEVVKQNILRDSFANISLVENELRVYYLIKCRVLQIFSQKSIVFINNIIIINSIILPVKYFYETMLFYCNYNRNLFICIVIKKKLFCYFSLVCCKINSLRPMRGKVNWFGRYSFRLMFLFCCGQVSKQIGRPYMFYGVILIK